MDRWRPPCRYHFEAPSRRPIPSLSSTMPHDRHYAITVSEGDREHESPSLHSTLSYRYHSGCKHNSYCFPAQQPSPRPPSNQPPPNDSRSKPCLSQTHETNESNEGARGREMGRGASNQTTEPARSAEPEAVLRYSYPAPRSNLGIRAIILPDI